MNSNQLGFFLLMAIVAMAVCMAIIPIMMRIAPFIGMIDSPDGRKVHSTAVPRSGGVGIVLGILVPLFIWLDFTSFNLSLILGCLILLFFGAWDDAKNIRPAYKFIGQFLAAGVVVYYAEIYVHHFPFIDAVSIPAVIGQPFTVIAIVGMINALNLSDGLDGLAGGEALISLAAMVYLSFQFEGVYATAIGAATIGGIFGFLRFNSHPARIFMGDAGSQTLGFILAVLAVYLTQNINPAVSPVVALMLLGLPIIDSIVVFYSRAKRGDSLVVAAKDHLHHRLLALGFHHYESVMVIYSIQIALIVGAVLMPYESDLLLMTIYLSICVVVFGGLMLLEKSNWAIHVDKTTTKTSLFDRLGEREKIILVPYRILKAAMSLFIVSAAVMSSNIPNDFGISSLILLVLLLVSVFFSRLGEGFYRLLVFVTIGFSVYLLSIYPPQWLLEKSSLIYIFFIAITVLSFVTMRITVKNQFEITPLDYLVVIMAVIAAFAPGVENGASSMIWIVVQIIILFYASELVIQNMKSQLNSFTGTVAIALALIAYRGLV